MITQPVKIVKFDVGSNHIYALDEDGTIWYRKTLPHPSYSGNYNVKDKNEREEDEEARKPWKRVSSMGKVEDEVLPTTTTETIAAPINPRQEVSSPPSFFEGGGVGDRHHADSDVSLYSFEE